MVNDMPVRAVNVRAREERMAYLRVETEILNKPELKNALTTWLRCNEPVEWIVEKVRTHDIEVTPAYLSAFAVRQGVAEHRTALITNLIPWKVHLFAHQRMPSYRMLRAEANLRAGVHEKPEVLNRLVLWKSRLRDRDLVIDYRPETAQVWWEIARRPGIDLDLVRVPGA